MEGFSRGQKKGGRNLSEQIDLIGIEKRGKKGEKKKKRRKKEKKSASKSVMDDASEVGMKKKFWKLGKEEGGIEKRKEGRKRKEEEKRERDGGRTERKKGRNGGRM